MSWLAPILVMSVLLAGCVGQGPIVAAPEVAGTVIAVDRSNSVMERFMLDSGATVIVDRNKTIIGVKTTPEAKARDLIIAGHISEGDWVMELGAGSLGVGADAGCFGLRLDALDAGDSVIFQVEPRRTTEPRWRLRLPKTRTFGGLPANDGSYLGGTIFCLNGRGEVTGQLPR